MTWLIDNLDAILLAVTTTVAAASAIAALTPTPKDDAILHALRKLVDALALNIGNAKPKA